MSKSMGRSDHGEKPGGIEIISIGKLYAGPWDKKYWSSSRGKDRYPYPVGYKSMRTQNSVPYMMEILEGVKGPSFTITSNYGKACCGDTPDIAWESFQKKDLSQTKLGRGKRYSSKIDGVEFFGFKNNYVQRLLRELVVNIGGTAEQSQQQSNFSNGTAEQSLLQSNFSNKVVETNHQQEIDESRQNPDLLVYLDKSCVTRKRSRKVKADNSKQLAGTRLKQRKQKSCSPINSPANSNQRNPSGFLGSAASEFQCNAGEVGTENKAILMNNKTSLQSEGEFVSSLGHLGVSVTNSTEPSDRAREAEVKENAERKEMTSSDINHILQAVGDADLLVPDTLDQIAGISSFACLNAHLQEIAYGAMPDDDVKPEDLVADALPGVEIGPSASSTGSEKCYTDSVGQDISTSMMTLLLPRALPLLKTFSRKKKKNSKHPIVTGCASYAENISSTCERAFVGEVVEHSNLDMQKEKNFITCDRQDLVASTSGNLDTVVSDSFDADVPQHLLQQGTEPCPEPCVQGPLDDKEETNALLCGSRDNDNNIHCEPETFLPENLKKGAGNDYGPLVENAETPTPSDKRIINNSEDTKSDCHYVGGLPFQSDPAVEGNEGTESITCSSFPDISMIEKYEEGIAGLHEIRDKKSEQKKVKDDMQPKFKQHMILNNGEGLLKLSACYIHPMSISMVQLIVKETEIFILVMCGHSDEKESFIFLYNVPSEGGRIGCPSLIGHASVALQLSRSALGKNIDIRSSLFQLAPDSKSLVLLDMIKTPYCREGNLLCACPACASNSLQENAVKIIRLNNGHCSFVSKLETTEAVLCLLVCEPNFLLAAEEGGKLKLWIMNPDWSGPKECCYIPPLHCVCPGIAELKRVPKSETMVIGHNGYGEFGLWDIDRRNLISMFSSPGISVYKCLPISIFSFQKRGGCQVNKQVEEIMGATKVWSSQGRTTHIFSTNDENVGVWLLISTDSDPNGQLYGSSKRNSMQEDHGWRLALLINNTVITGETVDRGVAAVTSDGHGIIGTSDGQVHMWELSTGTKLANFRLLKGAQVSTIVTTDSSSSSGALGIATDTQLLIYLPQ